jgi:amino acid adenylation domain-containing protein
MSGTAASFDTFGALLRDVAARDPHRPAIVERDRAFTYAELDTMADSIARCVAGSADGRAGFACLLFESRALALPAIYGVARSGRAYVPLDAGDPDDRLRFILQDSQPVALLTETAFLGRARELAPAGCPVFDVSNLPPGHERVSLPIVSPDAVATCFYTSGSTGQAKGVLQTHRNMLYFCGLYARAIRAESRDRLSLLFTLSFGASITDILGSLIAGATLCSYDVRREGIPGLADWLDRERVTVLHAVPTVVRELFEGLGPGRRLEHVRAIGMAAQTLFDRDVTTIRPHVRDDCVLDHWLAMTEAHRVASHLIELGAFRSSGGVVPVGRPPEGVHLEILREDGSAAGTDEVGEILVSSPHVSPGYWHRPDLDAAAFAPDPDRPGWRRYRSGDLGRIDAAGNLHFLGRRGSRVKIRGHSVDLVEVEAGLSRCAGVREAAVVARSRNPDGEPDLLVAHVVLADDAERTPLELRRDLAARLPHYMLPSAFVFLDAMPLTSTGKTDRRALEALELPPPTRPRSIEPPRDDLERAVASIFEHMLAVSPVGRGDDFFLLGGDSLALAELQTRLRDTCGATLPGLVEDSTVAGIAASIRRSRATDPATRAMPVLLPLRESGSATPLFLVHGRHGPAMVSPKFLSLLGDDQPVWAFQARGLDGLREPQDSVEAMARDYLAEMRERQGTGPYFLGALCAGSYVAAEMAHALRAAGETVLPLLLIDPPHRQFWIRDEYMTDREVLKRLREFKEKGTIDIALDDPFYARASIRTAVAFERAIAGHRPRPYDGPVFMLSSRKRAKRMMAGQVHYLFPRAEWVEIGSTHTDALDPDNPLLAEHLARFVRSVHESAAAASAAAPQAQ